MPSTNLQEAIERLADAADGVVSQLLDSGDSVVNVSNGSAPVGVNGIVTSDPKIIIGSAPVGVNGIVTSDPKIIESIVRIAAVVGQPVVIDYTDEYFIRTRGRRITPESISEDGVLAVVAKDEYRNGSIRRFRIDRIDTVMT